MTKIVFVDELPEAKRPGRGGSHREFVSELRNNPQRWAILGTYTEGAIATYVKSGAGSFKPKGAFDAVSRKNEDDDRYTVYVKYMGEFDAA